MAVVAVMMATGFTSCHKNPSIIVSTQNLWFGLEAETQTIEITANCKWTVDRTDYANWYTITPTDGKKDGSISITVQPLKDSDFRGSSFVITSPGGHIRRTVFISQNKLDFDGLYNKVFSVMSLEHWNTDYFGQIIEDSYQHYEYDPYDTAQGYQMYFFDNGTGAQKDNVNHLWFSFTYEFNPISNDLSISFETVDGSPEDYNPEVLTASDSLFRFFHEYKPNFWERADMRKIGIMNPHEKEILRGKTVKRKEKGTPIFQF